MSPVFEVVSGQVLLHRRSEFHRLHSEVLLPIMKSVGIEPVLLLTTEVGRYNRFLDIYRYRDFADYEQRTDAMLAHPDIEHYYQDIGSCVHGGIEVQLMADLPYARDWTR